jgi:glycerol 2-dehydrogenase (NADP+)
MAAVKNTTYVAPHKSSPASISVPKLITPRRKVFKLNTGYSMPAIGLGTWQSKPGEVEKAVEDALRAGYRHIDTAFAYGNEKEVGEGIRASGVPREQVFLTTKLDNRWHKRAPEALERSLANLGVEYIDLYLMHWPSSTDPEDSKKHYPDWDYVDTWREMQKLLETGKIRSIGVSNFGIQHFERLLNDPSCKVCGCQSGDWGCLCGVLTATA